MFHACVSTSSFSARRPSFLARCCVYPRMGSACNVLVLYVVRGSTVLRKLRTTHQSLFAELPRVIKDVSQYYAQKSAVVKSELTKLRGDYAKLSQSNKRLQAELNAALAAKVCFCVLPCELPWGI